MRKILIVGAGGGIGKAIAEQLSEAGHELFLMSSQPETLSHL